MSININRFRDLADVTGFDAAPTGAVGKKTAGGQVQVAALVAADLADSTPAGRSLLTAADAAAQRTALGAADAATLTAHTANTLNPHATTAAQVGALAADNNLSDLDDPGDARANLGLGTAATTNVGTAAGQVHVNGSALSATTGTFAAGLSVTGGNSSQAGQFVRFGAGSSGMFFPDGTSPSITAGSTSQYISFRQASAERARFAITSGNLLVNKTTDNGTDRLQIDGSLSAAGATFAAANRSVSITPDGIVTGVNGGSESGGLKVLSVRKAGGTETAYVTQYGAAFFSTLEVAGFTSKENGTIKAQPSYFSQTAGFLSQSTNNPGGSTGTVIAHYEAKNTAGVSVFRVEQNGAASFGGNLSIDISGTTPSSPRIIGPSGTGVNGNSLRVLTGDANQGFQGGNSQRMDVFSYHGIRVFGASASGPPTLVGGGGTADAGMTWYASAATNVPKATVAAAGQTADLERWYAGDGTTVLASVGPNGTITASGAIFNGNFPVAATCARLASGNITNNFGVFVGASVSPAIYQTGTAGYTALDINVGEAATGSGNKRLFAARLNNSDRWVVDRNGLTVQTGGATFGGLVQPATVSFATIPGPAGKPAWGFDTTYGHGFWDGTNWRNQSGAIVP